MEFLCPACNAKLRAQKLDTLRLWKCASCGGFVLSVPTVRKGLAPGTFKKIWQKISAGETEPGRPCPGCRKPLNVVEADGGDGAIMIDVCRSCQLLWFDDQEFSGLPKAVPAVASKAVEDAAPAVKPSSRVLTPEELTFKAFKEEQYRRRSFLFKLLDGSVAKDLGIKDYFGDFFDE
jgi:Zn-finger nucleic acid-binding protein